MLSGDEEGGSVSGGISNPAFINSEVKSYGGGGGGKGDSNSRDIELSEGKNFNNNSAWTKEKEVAGSSAATECSLFGFIPLPFCSMFLTAPWVLVFLCWASSIQVCKIENTS